ncbi:MAG: carboxypeptidase-like regulatory domain-containing protein, partial [Ferruginibacter sp.]
MRAVLTILLLLGTLTSFSQTKSAWVSGRIVDENDKPISKVSIVVLGKTTGLTSNDSGYFRIKVQPGRSFALVFSFTGYNELQKNFYLSDAEEEKITVQMERGSKTLQTVEVGNSKERTETGLVKINPKNAITLPSTTGGVEALIKILVGSNNELTSQYSVRGGNYDENLMYINDFE